MNDIPPSTSTSTPRTPPIFSPFSESTDLSEPTSEEQPDLGAFTTVLRAWNHLQPQPRIPAYPSSSSSSSMTYGRRSDADTDHTYGWSDSRSPNTYDPRVPPTSTQSTYSRQNLETTINSQPAVLEYPSGHAETPVSQRSSHVEGEYSNTVYTFPSSPPSPARVSTSTSFNFDRSTLAPTRSSARELDVEEIESTVWNQPRIASYLESEFSIGSAGLSAQSASLFVEDDREEEGVFSPPPSPESESSRTIEIASELDGGEIRVDSVTLEADDSTEQDQEVSFVSVPFHRAMESADYLPTSQDDINLDLDIQEDDQVVTPREISVMSRGSLRQSAGSYVDSAVSEREIVSYANELTTTSSLSMRQLNVQSIQLPFSQSSSPSHSSSRLSNSFATSSGSHYPHTMSSFSHISYQFSDESGVSPLSLPRFHAVSSVTSSGSAISPTLESPSEREREDTSHLNVPSPIPLFDISPDPVVDVDPSPVPSNSPRQVAREISFNEISNHALATSVSTSTGGPGPPDSQISVSPAGCEPQSEHHNELSRKALHICRQEVDPIFMDATTFHPIHHGLHLRSSQPYYETPAFLHELSSTVPTNESQPSLGYLDEALSFIAAERAKWIEQRESGSGSIVGDSKWKHVVEPRRKRRRKRLPKSAPSTLSSSTPLGSATPVVNARLQATTTDGDNDNDNDNDNSNDDDDDLTKDNSPGNKQVEGTSRSIDPRLIPTAASELSITATSQGLPKRGRTRKERGKSNSRFPEYQEGLEEDTPRPKRKRLQELAQKLQDLFPEDRSDLEIVIDRLGHGDEGSSTKRIPVGADEEDHSHEESETGENDLDPRGRSPRKDDTLIHVFIDHSNILIGLLSHLKRHPPSRVKQGKSDIRTSQTGSKRQMLPSVPTSAPTRYMANSHNDISTRHLAYSKESNGEEIPLIDLPSFATASVKDIIPRSLPSNSVLVTYMADRDCVTAVPIDLKNNGANSDGDEKIVRGGDKIVRRKSRKPTRHLWHAALTLILERGRPISRRVLVTSSPLYQPMDGIERLGYEVRIYLRVPDIGGGMDREKYRQRERDKGGRFKHAKSYSASGTSAAVGPSATIDNNGGVNPLEHRIKVSSSESSSANASGNLASYSINTNADLHPYYTATHLNNHINANNDSGNHSPLGAKGMTRIKYREQGVDELLQLKLHQALAATDDVPDGATIILATGDGNVGQFNEDGFLGPVRTALRKGWKVELYAWEDGLSRSWRREFGEDSEWGRNGMFRIIGMEQFANRLVEGVAW